MKKKEVIQELKSRFEILIRANGFNVIKISSQGGTAIRRTDFGGYLFTFSISDYEPVFKTTVTLGVGFEAVNVIDQIVSEIPVSKYLSSTIIYNYATYKGLINYYHKIETIDDIDNWVKAVEKFLNDSGFAFFEQYTTLESIDKLLNNSDLSGDTPYCPDKGVLIRNGLIAAKLDGNDEYDAILSKYKAYYTEKYKAYLYTLKIFDTLEQLLKNSSYEELLKLVEEKKYQK